MGIPGRHPKLILWSAITIVVVFMVFNLIAGMDFLRSLFGSEKPRAKADIDPKRREMYFEKKEEERKRQVELRQKIDVKARHEKLREEVSQLEEAKRLASLAREMGLLKKLDLDSNEAWVDLGLWNAFDYEQKMGASFWFALLCEEAGSTRRVAIRDNMTGKKLATYSKAWGFTTY